MERARVTLPVLEPRRDDADDVRWALGVAKARWIEGNKQDALTWLRRAADSARVAGNLQRAAELIEDAEELAEQIPPAESGQPRRPAASEVEIEVDVEELSSPARGSGEYAELDASALESLDADDLETELQAAAMGQVASSVVDSLRPDELIYEDAESDPPDAASVEDEFVGQIGDGLIVEEEVLSSAPPAASEPPAVGELLEEVDTNRPPPRRRGASISASELDLTGEELLGLNEPTEAPDSEPFNDRLSSVDVEPMSAEAAIAQVDEETPLLSLEMGEIGSTEHASPVAAAAADDARGDGAESRRSGQPVEPTRPDSSPPTVDDVALTTARGLEDLPVEVQRRLASSARVETLQRGEEIGFFGAALITNGAVDIMPAFAEDAGAQARHGDVVFTKGSLEESIELRVEAKIDETRVAVWDPKEIEDVLSSSPWVADELRFIADYYLAVCGATLGGLGERLDNSLRATVLSKMEVRVIGPGEKMASQGQPVDGLYVVGGGRIELLGGDQLQQSVQELSPGDFLFPSTMLTGQGAPSDARAGAHGALVMVAPREVARELMMSVPPLLELLAAS